MNITVFLAAHLGENPIFTKDTAELGEWIGQSGHRLIYGGSKTGLMGVLARQVLENGGQVTGIIPNFLKTRERLYEGLTELIEVEDMPERKRLLREKGDLFIALPGGPGTLEEITEVISLVRLGKLSQPCLIYNMAGFYDSFKALFDNMLNQGFITSDERDQVAFVDSLDELKAFVADLDY